MRPATPARIPCCSDSSPSVGLTVRTDWRVSSTGQRAGVQLGREVLRLLFQETAGDHADPAGDRRIGRSGDEITTRSTMIAIWFIGSGAATAAVVASAKRSAPSPSRSNSTVHCTGLCVDHRGRAVEVLPADHRRAEHELRDPLADRRRSRVDDLLAFERVVRTARELALLLGAARDRSRIGRGDDLQHGPFLQARGLPDHAEQPLLAGLALEVQRLVPADRASELLARRAHDAEPLLPRARSRSLPARRRPPPGRLSSHGGASASERSRSAKVAGDGEGDGEGEADADGVVDAEAPGEADGEGVGRRRRFGRRRHDAVRALGHLDLERVLRVLRLRPRVEAPDALTRRLRQAVGARGGRGAGRGRRRWRTARRSGSGSPSARRRARFRPHLDAGEERLGLGPAREALHLLAVPVDDADLRGLTLHLEAVEDVLDVVLVLGASVDLDPRPPGR